MRFSAFIMIFVFGSLGATSSLSGQADIQPFTGSSLKSIQKQHRGKPFLLILWRTDCPPCREELASLGAITQTFAAESRPLLPVVIVATDPIDTRAQLSTILQGYDLEASATWAYADSNTERLNFAIDPNWYGELPRSYFYSADGNPSGRSGKLTHELLLQSLAP
jgi:thiol-disulfide isomerase/thioredoxin